MRRYNDQGVNFMMGFIYVEDEIEMTLMHCNGTSDPLQMCG